MNRNYVNRKGLLKTYSIELEIGGDIAMFASADSGSNAYSYIAPPPSAIRGIISSIYYVPWVDVIPTKLEICNPIQTIEYGFNSHATVRTSKNLTGTKHEDGQADRYLWTVLYDVRYKIYADVIRLKNLSNKITKEFSKASFEKEKLNINHAHAFKDIFTRRVNRGQSHRNPCLGQSQFVSNYWGPLNEDTVPCKSVNADIILPSTLWDSPQFGNIDPKFSRYKIKEGVLNYVI